MTDHKPSFVDVYLKEIGVHTPVSFSVSADAMSAGEEKKPAPDLPEDSLSAAEPVRPEPAATQGKTLDELALQAASCRLCGLAETRRNVVFGTGDPHADVVFIGEAPGQDEDRQGEPFVGRAGQLLDRMLAATGLDRNSVYIMNTIKCRPPNNRDPRPDEVKACNLWFEQQLDLLQPKVLCLLGRIAAQTVLETESTLGSLRGRWHDYQGIPVWVTYHPAYLLRSPSQKHKSWQDMLTIQKRLHEG